MTLPLADRRIVVPESRELDLFSAMLERQGARVVRCPLVLIRDASDPADIDAWLDRLAAGAHHSLIFYTGEGVTRLLARAEARGCREAAIQAMAAARKIVRGPKPVAALRRAGLTADVAAEQPTTAGLVAVIATLDLRGQTVGVQLFPDNDGAPIRDALAAAGAGFDPVLPYRYASDEEDDRVADVISQMARGEVDLIAFTSSPQVRRLTEVAGRRGMGDELGVALGAVRIAAVGPVTAQAVAEAGGRVEAAPPTSFHLKPLVAEIVRVLGARTDQG